MKEKKIFAFLHSQWWPWLLTAIFLTRWSLGFLIGPEGYVRLHDTLEGELVWLILLRKYGVGFEYTDYTLIPALMNGLPRAALPPGFTFNYLAIHFLGGYYGYQLIQLFIHSVGFVGMVWLLRKHIIPAIEYRFISWFVAFCFGMIQVFPVFGLAVQGLPLLLYAYLNIYIKRDRWHDYLIILLFPFFTSFVWGFTTIATAVVLFIFVEAVRRNAIPARFILAFSAQSLVFLLVNLPLVFLYFFTFGFRAHRKEYRPDEALDALTGLADSAFSLFMSHYHVAYFTPLPILALMAIASLYPGHFSRYRKIFAIMTVVALCYGFYDLVARLLYKPLPIILALKAHRFITMLPMLWLILMALALHHIFRFSASRRAAGIISGCFLLMIWIADDELGHNIRILIGHPRKPGYESYFSESLFSRIKKDIGLPDSAYRVISIGMSPSVAQYNGFYTLDGLFSVYHYGYKVRFRELMAAELDRNPSNRKYFDNWGNRCYYFPAALGHHSRYFLIGKHTSLPPLDSLHINLQAFSSLGGKFIFSALPILHPPSGLRLFGVYEEEKSFWKIHVYENITSTKPIKTL